jgi:hypothetical protein
MKTSESQLSLVKALFEAQAEFPVILKTQKGQSGNRTFMYAPLDQVLDAVRPALKDHGLLLTQGVVGHDLVTRLDHLSGEWREHSMPVNAEHANMQSYGIELTYRRRYAIQPMLGIVTEEDTDGTGAQKRKGVDHTEGKNANGTKTAERISGPGEIFNQLQPEIQDQLRRKAPAVDAEAMTNAAKARDLVEMILDDYDRDMRNEIKTGLWYLLDSKTKSAIRKAATQ